MKINSKKKYFFGVFIILLGIYLAGPGWHLIYAPDLTPISPLLTAESAEVFVKAKESKFSNIKENNNSHILWSNGLQQKTKYALVYLHGFSASPKEISPVLEESSKKLNANVYFPRLSGHGLNNDFMEKLNSDQLFQDAEESYHIGQALGEKIVLVGTSTGASLATWLASRHPDIAAMILLSPNMGIRDPKGFLAAGPLGYWITSLIVGPYYEWIPKRPDQSQFWTSRYSARGINAMMNVVHEVTDLAFDKIQTPSLIFWTPQDKVVNIKKSLSILNNLGSEKKIFIEFTTAEHVLAGHITAPENVLKASETIATFVNELTQ